MTYDGESASTCSSIYVPEGNSGSSKVDYVLFEFSVWFVSVYDSSDGATSSLSFVELVSTSSFNVY